MDPLPKHHQREYLEQIIRNAPGGVTVADVCRHFGLSAREALVHLRALASERRIGMKLEDGAMVFRVKEQPSE